MVREHDDEQLLNGELAKLLTDEGVPSEAEQKHGRKKVDVTSDVDGVRVMLEAEAGFNKKKQAIEDADARLKQGLTVMAFAVCYEDEATVTELAKLEVLWALRTKADADWSETDWSRGSISELAAAVKQAPHEFDDVDGAARILSQALEAGAQRLSIAQRKVLAKAMELPESKPKGKKPDKFLTAAKRGLLVIATAMLFHQRLHEHLPPERPASWQGNWPPLTAAQCRLNGASAVENFDAAWAAIIEVDYKPVFATARQALAALPKTADGAQVVETLAKVVEQVARLVTGMRQDLLGRIFHRVLDTARYDGSFYTSTAAATLLASLAIQEDECDWAKPDEVAKLRICDPACGTGTLLMAAARRIQDLRLAAEGRDDPETEILISEELVEQVLWGYDINVTAAHMAASALGMLSPQTQFRKMNIHIAKFRVEDGIARTGSLEMLDNQLELDITPGTGRQVDSDEERQLAEDPQPMDLVIMNPPFTRDSLRYDQFSSKDEKAMKAREKQIIKNQPYQAAARLHSSGGMFTVLGEHLAHPNSGTLALILPAVVPTAPGNKALREYLASRFHVETIVTSHDPQRIFMSENTKISEVLIVCRRWDSSEPTPPTKILNLAQNPANVGEALALALELRQGGKSSPKFISQEIDADRMERGEWCAVNFYSPFLTATYNAITATNSELPFVPLSSFAEVGPAGQRIRDAFTKSEVPTTSSLRALWQHETDVTQAMHADTDSFIEPKEGKEHLAEKYWGQRSHMLLPHRLWLPLARVCAAWIDQPTVGSIWTPCRPFDQRQEVMHALVAFLNSSVGVFSLFGTRDNRKLSYPQFSLDSLRGLTMPDITSDAVDVERLANAFESLQGEVLLPLPEMDSDPIRKQLDEAVTEALGLDPEWVAEIRRSLAAEPAITNRRFGT